MPKYRSKKFPTTAGFSKRCAAVYNVDTYFFQVKLYIKIKSSENKKKINYLNLIFNQKKGTLKKNKKPVARFEFESGFSVLC